MNTPDINIKRTTKPILFWTLVVALGTMFLGAVMLWMSFMQQVASRQDATVLYSRMLESSITRTIESVEISLLALSEEIRATGDDALDLPKIKNRIDQILQFAPHIRQIVLTEGDAIQIDTSGKISGNIALNKLGIIRKDLNSYSGIRIGQQIPSRYLPYKNAVPALNSKRALLPLALKINNENNGHNYWLVAALNSAYIQNLFGELNLAKGDYFRFTNLAGTELIEANAGVLKSETLKSIRNLVKTGKDETVQARSFGIFPQSYISIRLSEKYPLAIAVSADHGSTLRIWFARNAILILGLIVATLIIIGAAFALMRDYLNVVNLQVKVRLLSEAVHQSPVSIIITDNDTRIQYVNPAFSRTFGYSFEEASGQRASMLKSGQTANYIYQDMRTKLSKGLSWQGEFVNKTRSGSFLPVTSAISPILNEAGQCTNMLGILTDISERKKAEKTLKDAHDQLEMRVENRTRELSSEVEERKRIEAHLIKANQHAIIANRSKTEFLANMSHELRTPLNAIIGFSEMLLGKLMGPLNNEKQEEYIADIHGSGHHLLNLINDILDVSAIEANKLEITESDIDLDDIVTTSWVLVKSRAEKGEINFNNLIESETFIICADERRMKQVLVNLFSNAVKFTGLGGEITIRAGVSDGGGLILYIADTGIGMTAKDIERAWEPFGQVADSYVKEREGTGLGLPLTKLLVEQQGGKIAIESELGVGTTVMIEFPIDKFRAL